MTLIIVLAIVAIVSAITLSKIDTDTPTPKKSHPTYDSNLRFNRFNNNRIRNH